MVSCLGGLQNKDYSPLGSVVGGALFMETANYHPNSGIHTFTNPSLHLGTSGSLLETSLGGLYRGLVIIPATSC